MARSELSWDFTESDDLDGLVVEVSSKRRSLERVIFCEGWPFFVDDLLDATEHTFSVSAERAGASFIQALRTWVADD